jgi:hypothetical protein
MSDLLELEVATAAKWLREKAEAVPFGEVAIKLVLHAGKVSRIEQSVTTKTQGVSGNARVPYANARTTP